ncbi:MAG: FAD-dependent oxidoreductase [Proteobacteria bacterium]|nr:FAD-dependent oxidoreductase [Pseudomonadota bacterium]
MTDSTHDLIVIGAGPAGLSAATEAARAGLATLCLDKLAPGGQLMNLGELEDVEEPWTGPDMAARLTDDAIVAGVELGFGEVTALAGPGPWTVETSEGERHTARAVVIATGLNKGKLGVPNEPDYEGRGLSHCAHCDGPLYAGLTVVVAGVEGWARHEAQELADLAGKLTIVDASDAAGLPDVPRIAGRIVALEGQDGLQSVTVESDGGRQVLPANAVFVYVDQSPAAEFVPDSLARDAAGHIVIDTEGRTSVTTAFAAGDVRAGARRSLADAIADGQRAAQAVVALLRKN